MASKRLKKKKQAAAVLQKQQPVQEKEPVTMEMEQNAQETENGGQDICFRMDVDLQQEEKEEMKKKYKKKYGLTPTQYRNQTHKIY